MAQYSGYIVVFEEALRADLLKARGSDDGRFTDALSAPDWRIKESEVCFVSFDARSLESACLAKRGARVVTGKYRVEFSDFVDLGDLRISDIEERMKVSLRKHFTRSISGWGQRVPPATWSDLVRVVQELRPSQAEGIDRLLQLRERNTESFHGFAAQTVALERDAVGISLDILDKSARLRKTTLVSWIPPEKEMVPFLQGIEAVRLTEEQMLVHDSGVFPGGLMARTTVSARFHLGDRILDVIYQNRTSVEKTLGVDLIYYNQTFDAYTLVQYKRMTGEKVCGETVHEAVFRPSADENFRAEMKRMEDFRSENPDEWMPPRDCSSFRLDGDGFFFKFCPSVVLEPLSADLIKGIYLPRQYLESLLRSELTDGMRGGKVITFENVQRHLTNTEFAWLVREGWLGTREISTRAITDVIAGALDAEKAVIHARSFAAS
jgi:hypothetical protein